MDVAGLFAEVRRLGMVVDDLARKTGRLPVRGGGGGGGGDGIVTYSTFPPIPAGNTGQIIRFSGDGGLWEAGPEDTHWVPVSRFTDYDGDPGEEA
jgi:hypothetical protein